MDMKVKVKLLSRFAVHSSKLTDGAYTLPEGSTAVELAEALGIAAKFVIILLINGRQKPPRTVLRDGDAVVFVPPAVGGG